MALNAAFDASCGVRGDVTLLYLARMRRFSAFVACSLCRSGVMLLCQFHDNRQRLIMATLMLKISNTKRKGNFHDMIV